MYVYVCICSYSMKENRLGSINTWFYVTFLKRHVLSVSSVVHGRYSKACAWISIRENREWISRRSRGTTVSRMFIRQQLRRSRSCCLINRRESISRWFWIDILMVSCSWCKDYVVTLCLYGRYSKAVPGYLFEGIENGYPGAAAVREFRGRLLDNSWGEAEAVVQ